MRHPERHGGNESAGPPPISGGAGLGHVVRSAFVTQIDLNHEQQCLSLRLMLRQPFPEQGGTDDPQEAWLRLPHVTNLAHVEAFFFGRKHRPVGEHLDQVLELKEKPDGCAIQLVRAGRVRIRTAERLVLEAP